MMISLTDLNNDLSFTFPIVLCCFESEISIFKIEKFLFFFSPFVLLQILVSSHESILLLWNCCLINDRKEKEKTILEWELT